MEQAQLVGVPHRRLMAAIVLGVISAAVSVALVVADGADAGAGWSHHAGVSAAPLLIIAAAIAVATLAHSHTAASVVKALVGVLAFATWGLAQLLSNSATAGLLGDVAILLFVLDAGYIILTDAQSFAESGRRAASGIGPGLDRVLSDSSPRSSGGQSPAGSETARVCCVRSADPCACAG
jgi:hypothetical protein